MASFLKPLEINKFSKVDDLHHLTQNSTKRLEDIISIICYMWLPQAPLVHISLKMGVLREGLGEVNYLNI